MYEKEIQRSKITPSRQKQANGKIFERYRTIIPRGIVRDFGFENIDCIILKQINDTIQIKFAKNNDLNFIKLFRKNIVCCRLKYPIFDFLRILDTKNYSLKLRFLCNYSYI